MNYYKNKVCEEYYQTGMKKAPKLYQGLDSMMNGLFGTIKRYARSDKAMYKRSIRIYDKAEKLHTLSDKKLINKLEEFNSLFRSSRQNLSDLHFNALIYLTEAAYRCLGLRPFPVQIMGSIALLNGYLAEMATGEGKTLTASLAAVIAGWSGKPCHIITVNDYLASRDSKNLSDFYSFCNLKVGSVISTMSQQERRINYANDIVYTTSKEILADFLRDRLKLGTYQHPGIRLIKSLKSFQKEKEINEELVMRGLGTAIVDEADSVLIDEAVTPLIISKPMKY